jgi:hypothetical protein
MFRHQATPKANEVPDTINRPAGDVPDPEATDNEEELEGKPRPPKKTAAQKKETHD